MDPRMKLPSITDDERPMCNDMRMLSTDREGREVFVGLDRDESEWYGAFSADRMLPDRLRDPAFDRQGKRYLQLHDKHEAVRLAILVAESEARHTPLSS